MLEKLPRALGAALSGVRAGHERALYHSAFADVPASITVASLAFEDAGPIPDRYTADGDGASPPLRWSGAPPEAAAILIVVEDPDAPAPRPLVHLIAWNLPGGDGSLEDGAASGAGGPALGRNSFLRTGWLPPDPPTGHGVHHYLFQVYALATPLALSDSPGREAVVEAMRGLVLAKGLLTGTYLRP